MNKNIHAMANYRLVKLLICSLALLIGPAHGGNYSAVPITYLESAKDIGAVCLDGSPPAYYFDEGQGDGVNNWMVYLQGGEWCSSNGQCHDDPGYIRKWKSTWNCSFDGCANSYQRSKIISFTGIMSGSQLTNPDFYNWNRVFVIYCDGGSFSGDVEEVDPATNVHRRGARLLKAIINDLRDKGMKDAKNAMLVGGSAGGLATLLNCDNFRNSIPDVQHVKCIADSGFFIHAPDLPGAKEIREKYYGDIVAFHGIEKILPQACLSKMPPGWCMFADNLIQYIQTPVFIIDSAFDAYQLSGRLPWLGPAWLKCVTNNPKYCVDYPSFYPPIKDFRAAFLNALPKCGSVGMFIDTCQVHGHTCTDERWTGFTLNNKSLAQSVGDWYFERSEICAIDTQHDFIQYCNTSFPEI